MATDSKPHPEMSVASEELVCFVCGVPVSGKFYPLATCRLLCTKTPIIEKMSQLVGESYVVVITEDDVICRSCANLLNTLDRLEVELGSVRSVVLRFLERKYELSDGELVNSKPVEVGQPPQITPGQGKLEQYAKKENFMARKRRQALDEIKKENGSADGTKHKGGPKNPSSLLQCDKCKYTTSYNAFMIHHIRQHVKPKTACDFCGMDIERPGGTCPQKCTEGAGEQAVADVTVEASGADQPAAALCAVPDGPVARQTQLMEVQKMEDEDSNAVYVQVVDVGKGNGTDDGGNLRKQVLTVADDGTVEMVEVLWDEMITPDVEGEQHYLQQ
ncbi:uncharacterized protein LOC134540755 [Bacillus rossius redtenbacheri]|uniref:uncharacterized protein LOC134540755 n=1 Tax=Bacillus rossius redtenbacheri TaxID=93214 RepID=UPI002FDD08A3